MLLQVIFLICLSDALAEKNFWNNEICYSNIDCTGLTSCDPNFGCTLSAEKVGYVFLGVITLLAIIGIFSAWICTRRIRNYHSRSHTHYVHSVPVIATNSPPWNQQRMGTTSSYPYPYPNQMYANAGSPNTWNQHQMGQATTVNPPVYNQYPMGHTMNVGPVPTAPDVDGYKQFDGYKQSTQTHYPKQ